MTRDAGRVANPFAAACRHPGVFAIAAFCAAFFPAVMAAEPSGTAEVAPIAPHALLLDIVKAGAQLIAVGEQGDVVVSRDDGRTWTQIIVPARALLTAIAFPDPTHGWIVGHDGVIMTSDDGGVTWTRQDSGKDLDTVFLDVFFLNASRGFAVGAYGKFLATENAGKTWAVRKPSDDEVHYNSLAANARGSLFLTGESGTLLTSADGGVKWRHCNVPYDGSLFGTLPVGKEAILVYGLRGHILRSTDEGATWEPKNSDTRVLINCGLLLNDGTIVLGGQGGNFFISHDAGGSFIVWKPEAFNSSIAGMVETDDGTIVTVGEAGAVRIKLP